MGIHSVRWELQKCHCNLAWIRCHLEYHVQDKLSIIKKDKIELEEEQRQSYNDILQSLSCLAKQDTRQKIGLGP